MVPIDTPIYYDFCLNNSMLPSAADHHKASVDHLSLCWRPTIYHHKTGRISRTQEFPVHVGWGDAGVVLHECIETPREWEEKWLLSSEIDYNPSQEHYHVVKRILIPVDVNTSKYVLT